MRVLITGCAGFIGYHLSIKLLQEKNIKIVGIDNLNDYYSTKLKKLRLAKLKESKNFEFFKSDLSNPHVLNKLINKNFDCVIHLAAQAGVRYSLLNQHSYISSNILGFFHVIDFIKKEKIKNFIYASSSSIYGDREHEYVQEGIADLSSRSIYAATKLSNELLANAYFHQFGINSIGLRFFTVYGDYGRPDMAYFMFTKAIDFKEKFQLFNNGEMSRDMTHVDDVVDSILQLIKLKPKGYQIFNVGGGCPVKTSELVSIIEKSLGKKANYENVEFKNEILRTSADSTKLNQAINKESYIDINLGMKRFIKWYLNNRDNIY